MFSLAESYNEMAKLNLTLSDQAPPFCPLLSPIKRKAI